MAKLLSQNEESQEIDTEEEEEEELDNWEDWMVGDEEEGGGSESELVCLFCDSKYSSCDELFEHCRLAHKFDFHSIRKAFNLDFYGCFKLINYVRSQMAENRCWNCGFTCQSKQELQNHSHETFNFMDGNVPWDDDKYLKPFILEDSLLFSFGEDEEGEEDYSSVDKEELMKDMMNWEGMHIDDESPIEVVASDIDLHNENGRKGIASASGGYLNMGSTSENGLVNGNDSSEYPGSSNGMLKDKNLRNSFAKVAAKEIRNVNENYFGAYSSFGIHREMLSDKVRTDAYRQAIVSNPSLLNGAVVLDIGCGTGILSLFAAQAGASRVFAVEASNKMASVATQIAKENGLLCSQSPKEGNNHCTGVIKVVEGMIEELDKSGEIKPHSVDVLISEWMGYCLLYEAMLSSVLFARDRWLKPGGAILPDTATMFAAGFGRGGTSIPFWENVYGFNMSCIGKELIEDAARIPIVDVMDSRDIVTNSVVLQAFDLATMKPEEMDFTTIIELEPKLDSKFKPTQCYGVVLWFETGFTSRFCKETPTVLSTSPYTPKTHWSQTILTFREPISVTDSKSGPTFGEVGSDACPAVRVHLRLSIARAPPHRSIDISLETTGIGADGRKRSWPVQIFNLC